MHLVRQEQNKSSSCIPGLQHCCVYQLLQFLHFHLYKPREYEPNLTNIILTSDKISSKHSNNPADTVCFNILCNITSNAELTGTTFYKQLCNSQLPKTNTIKAVFILWYLAEFDLHLAKFRKVFSSLNKQQTYQVSQEMTHSLVKS